MNYRLVILLLLFPAVLLAQPETEKPQKSCLISGVMKDLNGKPVPDGYVHFTRISDRYEKPIAMFQTGNDGAYQFPVYGSGFYKVWFVAPSHQIYGVPLLVEEEDKAITIDIELAPYSYKDDFSQVKVIGSWNKFDFATAKPMKREADGTYSLIVDTNKFSYQLTGVTKDARSINGTFQQYLEYDKAGDFQSLVRGEGKQVKLIFDPKKLLRTTRTDLPKVTIDFKHSSLMELDLLLREVKQKSDAALSAYDDLPKAKQGDNNFLYDYGTLPERMRKVITDNTRSLKLRQLVGMNLLLLPGYKPASAETLQRDLMKVIPPQTPLWTLYPEAMGTFAFMGGKEKAVKVFDEFLTKHADQPVKIQAIAQLGLMAKTDGDTAKVRQVYKTLLDRFGMFDNAQLLLMEFNLDHPLAIGKTVPDFKVKILGEDKTVSAASIKGKYYLLHFWASWFMPSRDEIPRLESAVARYKPKGLHVLSFSFDDAAADLTKFRYDEYPMAWEHTWIEGGINGESAVRKNLDIKAMPFYALIDPAGKVVANGFLLRGSELQTTLGKFLK
jgi:thiol-disulfide isomerase/thioredoxin